MALVKIDTHKDRIILDQEYNAIVNNINLAAIEDKEILSILQELMDTLTECKLAEEDKKIFQKEYNRRAERALYDAMLEGLKFRKGLPLVKLGGVYVDYRFNRQAYRDELDEKVWRLEADKLKKLNELRKKFQNVYWKLIKTHHIPDEWRLTEKQLKRAVSIFDEQDAEKKLRQLEEMQFDFQAFPPFRYALAETLAQTAEEVQEYEKALKAYERIEQDRIPFLRKDHEFSSALMTKVVLVQTLKEVQPNVLAKFEVPFDISRDLRIITKNSPYDWRKNLFVALQYITLGDYDKAKALIRKNIDNEEQVPVNTRILGEIYALSDDEENLTQLISKMYNNDKVRYQDALYLVGKVRNENLLRNVLDTFLQPSLADVHFRLERKWKTLWKKDRLFVSIPAIWTRHAPEDFPITIKFLNAEREFVSETSTVDEEKKTVHYFFKGVINEKDFLWRREHKTMVVKLKDPAQTISLYVDVRVKDESKEKDKTKLAINFSIKEIHTSAGVHYRMIESGVVERLSERSL